MLNLKEGSSANSCGEQLCFPLIKPMKTDEYTPFSMTVKLPPSVFVDASNPVNLLIEYSPSGLLSGPDTLSLTSNKGAFLVTPISQSDGHQGGDVQAYVTACIPGIGYKKACIDICEADESRKQLEENIVCKGSLVDEDAGTCREVIKIYPHSPKCLLGEPCYYETATDMETEPTATEVFSSEPCDMSSVICLTCT